MHAHFLLNHEVSECSIWSAVGSSPPSQHCGRKRMQMGRGTVRFHLRGQPVGLMRPRYKAERFYDLGDAPLGRCLKVIKVWLLWCCSVSDLSCYYAALKSRTVSKMHTVLDNMHFWYCTRYISILFLFYMYEIYFYSSRSTLTQCKYLRLGVNLSIFAALPLSWAWVISLPSL